MRKIINVRGTQVDQPESLKIGIDTVYVRENIIPVNEEDFKGWQYDETQYDKDEYIALLANREQLESIETKLMTADEKYKQLDKTIISLEEMKVAKVEQLKEMCTNAIYEGFVSTIQRDGINLSFGFNEHDQANISQQMLLIVADTSNKIINIDWKTTNKGIVSLTKDEFLSVVNSAKEHKLNQQKKYWLKEDLVNISVTKEEVDSVVW